MGLDVRDDVHVLVHSLVQISVHVVYKHNNQIIYIGTHVHMSDELHVHVHINMYMYK